MPFSKELSLPGGKLSVSEQAGQVTLAIEAQEQVGGGQAAGIVQIEGSGKVVISGKQAMDLAFGIIEAHLPAAAALIAKEVQTFADLAIDKA